MVSWWQVGLVVRQPDGAVPDTDQWSRLSYAISVKRPDVTQTHPSKIKNLPLVSELFGSRKVCVLINAKHYAYPLKHSVTITWSATIGRRFNVVMVLLYNNDEPTYVTQYQQLKRFLTQRKQQGSASRKTKRLKCKETV